MTVVDVPNPLEGICTSRPFHWLFNDRTRINSPDFTGNGRIAPWGRRDLSAGPSKILTSWMDMDSNRCMQHDPARKKIRLLPVKSGS